MTEKQFVASQRGQAFVTIVRNPEMIDRMIEASRRERTALEAVDPVVARTIGVMENDEKKAAGRVVKTVLRDFNFVPWKKDGRVRNGRVFNRGTVYREIMASTGAPTTFAADKAKDSESRYSAAREILLAGRRDPDRPLAGVDAFLTERRAMWDDA